MPLGMVIRGVEFSREGYIIIKFFAKNQNTQMKLLNFENWGVYTGKMPKIGNRFRK